MDQLVRDIGPVVLRGVDVIDAELDSPPQDAERSPAIRRRPEDPGTGELHCAEADATHGAPGEGTVSVPAEGTRAGYSAVGCGSAPLS